MILPSITTLNLCNSSWHSKILEVEELQIRHVALFVTGLSNEERALCFEKLQALRRKHDFSIPFVHAVSRMKEEEYLFLMDNFGTDFFNLHPLKQFPLTEKLSTKVREHICIENASSSTVLEESDLEGFAGICLDISHLEDTRRVNPVVFLQMEKFLSTHRICANHISGSSQVPEFDNNGTPQFSRHLASGVKDFDYLSRYPETYFSSYCAIEVENSLREQLTFVAYIESMLKAKSSQDLATAA